MVSFAYPRIRIGIYLAHYIEKGLPRNLTWKETGDGRRATTGQGVGDCVMVGTQCHQIIFINPATTGPMNYVVGVQ